MAAVPCKQFCDSEDGKCGNHINDLFDNRASNTFELFNCQKVDCRCIAGNHCRFYQGYAEGSSYYGYLSKDMLYLGENYHYGVDMFEYTFGCIYQETKYFYS